MIDININGVLDSVKTILVNAYTKELSTVKEIVGDYIVDAEERLTSLAKGALNGDLSYKEVISFLNDEKIIIKDDLLAITEIVGADLQNLINKAIDIFEFSLKSAIPNS